MFRITFYAILGDPGAVIEGGKKSKRVRKNSGEKKPRRRRRAPGDKVLTILGDPGAVSGGGKKSKRVRKIRAKKGQEGEEASSETQGQLVGAGKSQNG